MRDWVLSRVLNARAKAPVWLLALCCGGLAGLAPEATWGQKQVVYEASDEFIANPERGFSAYRSRPLSESFLAALQDQQITVVQRIFTLPHFADRPFDAAFLEDLESDLNRARQGGVKLVLRFSYTDNIDGADAPLEIIAGHIDQLEPFLRAHADIIAYVEAGFIGAWGEWYYSTNGLNNTQSRRAVLLYLLEALPSQRMAVVRTPDYKRRIFAVDEPLAPAEAFAGTPRARTGAHNDCFLASATDFGTYGAIEADKAYLALDNRFVPQGGETCNPSAFSDCAHALVDLARMRWSVLNKDYHPEVLAGWVEGGCMDEVRRRLGYRFRLQEAGLPQRVGLGQALRLELVLVNDGWASPYNPRAVELLLRHQSSGTLYRLPLQADPRGWLPGAPVRLVVEAGIPASVPAGEYDMLLHLPDPAPTLGPLPAYAIRLANTGVWEAVSGYNNLLHSVLVDAGLEGDGYSGEHFFRPADGGDTWTGQVEPVAPGAPVLDDNFPNPFNPRTHIAYTVHRAAPVRLAVYDGLGQAAEVLFEGFQKAGRYWFDFAPVGLGSGLYLYRLEVGEWTVSKKMIYIQ
ncbi:MAG: DUF4832 domain-containing protein [Candidatus Latescibacteria bacterium]|nr:DUF4832 domain-containing protein [Candidatus Latescibacterota bacterium]